MQLMSCCFLACAVGVANQKKKTSFKRKHLPIGLFPGSCVGEKEKSLHGKYCLGMCQVQVPLVTCILSAVKAGSVFFGESVQVL